MTFGHLVFLLPKSHVKSLCKCVCECEPGAMPLRPVVMDLPSHSCVRSVQNLHQIQVTSSVLGGLEDASQ